MKKLFLLVLCVGLFTACASVKEAKNLSDCTYTLKSVEVSDYNITSLDFLVTIAIKNPNKTEPATLKRFTGELTANDTKIADIELKDVKIDPNTTKLAKAKVNVPMVTLGSKLMGLLSMGSATVDYHLTGTMYFEGPLGTEIPLPVDIGRIGSYN